MPSSQPKNYITPQGFKRLQDEYHQLKHKERPEIVEVVAWAASNGDRSENGDYIYGKKKLREIDRRLRFLSQRMEAAEIVDPKAISAKQVLFGATVTIVDENDKRRTFSIVGTDESDPDNGKISWLSPLAKALFKAKEGDIVTYNSPQGEKEAEILSILYKEIP
jgi:transcription elongation factor GreB